MATSAAVARVIFMDRYSTNCVHCVMETAAVNTAMVMGESFPSLYARFAVNLDASMVCVNNYVPFASHRVALRIAYTAHIATPKAVPVTVIRKLRTNALVVESVATFVAEGQATMAKTFSKLASDQAPRHSHLIQPNIIQTYENQIHIMLNSRISKNCFRGVFTYCKYQQCICTH